MSFENSTLRRLGRRIRRTITTSSRKTPVTLPNESKQDTASSAFVLRVLPTEIFLDIAERLSLIDVRSLASTVRYMHSILFIDPSRLLQSSGIRGSLLQLLYASVRVHTSATLRSLAERPDITRHIQTLVVSPNRIPLTARAQKIKHVDESWVVDMLLCMSNKEGLKNLVDFSWLGVDAARDDLWPALNASYVYHFILRGKTF